MPAAGRGLVLVLNSGSCSIQAIQATEASESRSQSGPGAAGATDSEHGARPSVSRLAAVFSGAQRLSSPSLRGGRRRPRE